MCSPRQTSEPRSGTGRRTFLRTTGLVGAGVAMTGLEAAPTAAAASVSGAAGAPAWHPDPDSLRFTVAVMPDTQYLFDGESIHPAPVEASFRYLLRHAREENIVFLSHLGDLTEHGQVSELGPIDRAFRLLDERGAAYSVVAGNHDLDSSTDDQRGRTPYLDTFGPRRYHSSPSFRGAGPDGYNTYHTFRAAGREWLVLALDWRPSAKGIAWAREVIAGHPRTPVILTTHELVYADHEGEEARFSDHGQWLWDELIADHDQIFLTLNGHYWPPARTVRRNKAGHDVHLHITNYQDRYYGGAGMIRLYRFDLARHTVDVRTLSPWILDRADEHLNELERGEIERTSSQDYFSVPIDFEQRFAGFAPTAPRPARPASRLVIPGTVAYWRFDQGGRDGAPVEDSVRITDHSGRGNHLTKVAVPGSPADALSWSDEHHPDQPGHGSLSFHGDKSPLRGAYLRTADGAPLNGATFRSGYTVEAFLKLPADWDGGRNAWSGLLGRRGPSGQAGKTGGDMEEPVVTLSLSDGHGLQWAVYPLNEDGAVTNWSHELPLNTWWHAAVVNDGRHTTMYVNGCPVARNPSTPANGLTTLGLPWLLGGYEYGGKIDQIMYGWIGDVRVVDRALPVGDFMSS
ncbi:MULTISPECIES: LamG-like jellyroll fold domain-containing protein [Streptomyces violaceusniger group]|uniref:LamG domain-containing protein n=1 Tax=Streptomyces rhizosphaericus TaxID=114699 RepID=A0ABN1NZ00_9ACTN|nr:MULTISPECIES: LamG-like jellyroll fold domain-containing protein [Streptomyces violaceusniger group]